MINFLWGSPVEDPGESGFLRRLCDDLDERGIQARVYANFVTTGRQQRQVDVLVVSPALVIHIEVKCFDVDRPLIATANGPWRQVLADQSERSLGTNCFRQAHDTTFAISDVMRSLARRGVVPPATAPDRFFAHIDTVVCTFPRVPRYSRVEHYEHVHVIGYQNLLDRFGQPGPPPPPWSERHWAEFEAELGLTEASADAPERQAHRADVSAIADYQRLARASYRAGLHELVPIAAVVEGQRVPAVDLVDLLSRYRVVCMTGESGTGKSHVARHAAVRLTDAGHVVVWLRCAEYGQWRSRRISDLIRTAVASCTTVEFTALFEKATRMGHEVVVVLDGVNECPPDQQRLLLDQLTAVTLRHPVQVVLTSTQPVELTLDTVVVDVRTLLPDQQERAAVLRSYGADEQRESSAAFLTPYELSLAAQCANELGVEARRSDLFDAYVRMRCPDEVRRAGLRRVAGLMNDRIRAMVPVADAVAAIRRTERGVADPDEVDAVLSCPLLVIAESRLRFTHELLGRFLSAERLVLAAPDGGALADVLRDARHGDLAELAMEQERDEQRRAAALLAFGDVGMLTDAALGRWGELTTVLVRSAVSAELLLAVEATESASLHGPTQPDQWLTARWQVCVPRTRAAQALLAAAGNCLVHGLFLSEATTLLHTTDRLCRTHIERLRAGGDDSPVSAITSCTYVLAAGEREDCLPASVLSMAVEWYRFRWWHRPTDPGQQLGAAALWDASDERQWGLLYLLLQVINPDSSLDQALLPDLMREAWDAGGYHLRLAVLERVQDFASSLSADTRAAVRATLEDYQTNNVFLNSAYLDALSVYGAIEPATSLAGIREEIAAVLAEPDDSMAPGMAAHIYYSQFENSALLGPYYEAVHELADDQMLQLCVLTARAGTGGFFYDLVLRDISDRAHFDRQAARDVLRPVVAVVDHDKMSRQEAVTAHLEALRGWALLADKLPAYPEPVDAMARAWRLIDELLFGLQRPDLPVPAKDIWEELLSSTAAQAVDVLHRLYTARGADVVPGAAPPTYHRLVTAHRASVVELLEWGLRNRASLESTVVTWDIHGRDRFLIDEVGALGTVANAPLLRSLIHDPELGPQAVSALRRIEHRTDTDRASQ
jgi:NACHT domain/Nuclease-related domain